MPTALIDRDTEIAALDRALGAAAGGMGGLVMIQGAAGIGKTMLLTHLREAAPEHGFRVLGARASELDRAFGYGVVHQLLEPEVTTASAERRAALLRGAARAAEGVLTSAGDGIDDGGYAVVHGLYWLVANLADEQPLVLLIDDIHWADSPSLRFLEYLGRRLDGLPVLVAATARVGEPGSDADLLGALSAGPYADIVEPGPLGDRGVDAILHEALGHPCEPGFVTAAQNVTGGNPLLVRVLAREAHALGLEGTAAQGQDLAMLAARGVIPIVKRRLATLGASVAGVALAAAVAGERALIGDIATLAGRPPTEARTALDQLAAAAILEPGGWQFVHPLIKAAVLESAPPGVVVEQHRVAAQLLRARAARPAEIALHWLATDPSGDLDAVADLRQAAAVAAADGATDVAVHHLRRAVQEPPAEQDAGGIELELAELEVKAQLPEGPPRLRSLLAANRLTGNDAARARAALGNHLVHTDPISALDEVAQASADATDPGLKLRLEAFTLEALIFPNVFAEMRAARFEAGRADPNVSPVMLAHLAVDGACAGLPATEVRSLAERALTDGSLLASVGPASSTYNLITHAFRFAEAPERCAQVLTEGERIVSTRGLVAAQGFINQSWGYWHRDFGSVAAGAARAQLGLESFQEMGLAITIPALAAITAENLIQLDRLDEALALIDVPLGPATDTYIEPFALTTRGYARFLAGRHDEAEADLRRLIALTDARGWFAPNAARARLRLAEFLAATNRGPEALELMEHDLRVARDAGLPGSIGMALRIRARAEPDVAAVASLHEAVDALRASPLRLELGWALHDLGTRLRTFASDADARDPLREALDLAAETESAWLARVARDALQAAGGRPRRERLSGTEALTPAERRVAELAAEGFTNREVAETLWVTLKTVEAHLGRTYAKLGISSRRELAGLLGPAAAPSSKRPGARALAERVDVSEREWMRVEERLEGLRLAPGEGQHIAGDLLEFACGDRGVGGDPAFTLEVGGVVVRP